MSTNKNIQMKQFNGTDYDNLYPISSMHSSSHATGGTDPLTPAQIGAVNANNHTTLNLDAAITTGHWTWVDTDGVFGLTGALYNIDVSSSDFSANQSIVQTATRTYPVNEAYPSITLKRTFYFTSGWTAWASLIDSVNLAAYLASAGGAKIATGSYVGTGTYGTANPTSIILPFSPSLVIVSTAEEGLCPSEFNNAGSLMALVWKRGSFIWTRGQTSASVYNDQYKSGRISFTMAGSTLSWWSIDTSIGQRNETNITYQYVAIG